MSMKKPPETALILMPVIWDMGDPAQKKLPLVEVRGKTKRLCRRSLYIFPIDGCFCMHLLAFVLWRRSSEQPFQRSSLGAVSVL